MPPSPDPPLPGCGVLFRPVSRGDVVIRVPPLLASPSALLVLPNLASPPSRPMGSLFSPPAPCMGTLFLPSPLLGDFLSSHRILVSLLWDLIFLSLGPCPYPMDPCSSLPSPMDPSTLPPAGLLVPFLPALVHSRILHPRPILLLVSHSSSRLPCGTHTCICLGHSPG